MLYIASIVILIASTVIMVYNRDVIYFRNVVEACKAQELPYVIGGKIIYAICMLIVMTSSYLLGIGLLVAGSKSEN